MFSINTYSNGSIPVDRVADMSPILSEWDRGAAGEMHYHPRVTYYADYLGNMASLWRWPISAGKIPALYYCARYTPGEAREAFAPDTRASGFGCVEARNWKSMSKAEYKANAAMTRLRDTKKDHERYRDMGVGLVPESFRYADNLINPKGAGHE